MTELIMTEDETGEIASGLQELFAAKPELFGAVRELIETLNHFLYDTDGGDMDNVIEVFNGCVPQFRDAAQGVPSLRAWAKQLEDFQEAEFAKMMRGSTAKGEE